MPCTGDGKLCTGTYQGDKVFQDIGIKFDPPMAIEGFHQEELGLYAQEAFLGLCGDGYPSSVHA